MAGQAKPIHVWGPWMDEDKSIAAYTTGDKWNGFECPLFERSVLQEAIDSGVLCPRGESRCFYDASRDAFYVLSNLHGDDIPSSVTNDVALKAFDDGEREIELGETSVSIEESKAVTVSTEDGKMKLYGVGAYMWCWEASEPANDPNSGMKIS